MRRSRTPLTAWPAFADLMTILTVVSLAIAVFAVSTKNGGAECKRKLEECEAEKAELKTQIKKLKDQIRFGHNPCLGTQATSRSAPISLLRIVVASSGYRLIGMWPRELNDSVMEIPELREVIDHGDMAVHEFERYALAIYEFGDRDNIFGDPCRFFVELKNETDSSGFARAVGVVSGYFLLSNSSEVNRILRGSE